nr:hypothetical protein L203_05918 [Cryptococcus depauperatus CBS 7841]
MVVDLLGIYVDRISENVSSSSGEDGAPAKKSKGQVFREKMAQRTNKELYDGANVNLGVGIPVLATNYLPEDMKVWVQSENGILGIINAGEETVTLIPGASAFDSSESFGMIRGGHVDVSIFGAMEVSANGDLVNYMIP